MFIVTNSLVLVSQFYLVCQLSLIMVIFDVNYKSVNMSRWELTYGIGSLQTYKFKFKASGEVIEEYIHCEVLEWTESNKFEKPLKIKVRQFRNLQEYFAGKKLRGYERILEVAALESIYFRKEF
jgi:hypothetical protein